MHRGSFFLHRGHFFCTRCHFFCTGLIFFAHGVIFFAHHCNIVKESSAKKRQKYELVFKQVKILSNIDNYERSKLADAIKERKFKTGDIIIKQGDVGEEFFIVTDGKAKVLKEISGVQKEVMKYEVGNYFGEISLLKNEPRAATVVAETDLTVVYLDRKMFKRLLGPLEEILKRNMSVYTKFS